MQSGNGGGPTLAARTLEICRRRAKTCSDGAPDVLTQRRASDLAYRAVLLQSAGTQCLGEVGVDAHLHTRGGAPCAERRPPDRDLGRLVQVVAALGLLSERFDLLVAELL